MRWSKLAAVWCGFIGCLPGAALAGDTVAQANLARSRARLGPAQIAEAERRAQSTG